MSNRFRKFSQIVYAAPGVHEECLRLQDDFEINVNLLLFCAYLGLYRQTVISERELSEIFLLVETWHRDVVAPLRAIRRRLKNESAFGTRGLSADKEKLRASVKAIELDSEYIEQSMLEGWLDISTVTILPSGAVDRIANNIASLFAASAAEPGKRSPALPRNLIDTAAKLASID